MATIIEPVIYEKFAGTSVLQMKLTPATTDGTSFKRKNNPTDEFQPMKEGNILVTIAPMKNNEMIVDQKIMFQLGVSDIEAILGFIQGLPRYYASKSTEPYSLTPPLVHDPKAKTAEAGKSSKTFRIMAGTKDQGMLINFNHKTPEGEKKGAPVFYNMAQVNTLRILLEAALPKILGW